MVKTVQVLVVALASAWVLLPARAAAQNQIEVREVSTGPAIHQPLKIRLSATNANAKKYVLLSRTDGKEQAGIQLEALVNGNAAVTFTPNPVNIPAGRPALVIFEVTLAEAGTATAEILADGKAIAKLEIEKAAATPVSLLGADATTGLTLKTEVSDFRHTFRLVSTVPQAQVRLTAQPFIDPTGTQVQPTLELEGAATSAPLKLDLDPEHPVAVTLGLSTPLSGEYSGLLELRFGGQTKPVLVKVTRSKVAPTVSFDPIPQARVYDWFLSEATAEADVSLRETSGRPTTIDRLALVSVVRKETEADVAANLAAKEIRKDRQAVTTPLQVAAGGTESLSVYLRGLPGPGKYEARLRLASGDGTPLESTLIVLVRYHWWIFLVWVFVFVGLSAWLRWYFTVRRPQLVDRARLSEALGRLQQVERELGKLEPVEAAVVAQLREHIHQLYWETERLRPGGVEEPLKLLELKLARVLVPWVRARRQGENDATKAVELYLRRREPSPGKTPEVDTEEQLQKLKSVVAKEALLPDRGAPWEDREIPDARQLRRQLLWFELATSAVAFLIASLLGAVLLYFPNTTWGNLQDLVVAALWGLGLHQVNGKAFEGASWIKRQFGLPAGEL